MKSMTIWFLSAGVLFISGCQIFGGTPGSSASSPSPRESTSSSGNICKDVMTSALSGDTLLLNKHPDTVGKYLGNVLFFPLGLVGAIGGLVAPPLMMVFDPSGCRDTPSTAGSSYSGSPSIGSVYRGSDYKGKEWEPNNMSSSTGSQQRRYSAPSSSSSSIQFGVPGSK
jgi:hypothetical protein